MMDGIYTISNVASKVPDRITAVENKIKDLEALVKKLESLCLESQRRISALEFKILKQWDDKTYLKVMKTYIRKTIFDGFFQKYSYCLSNSKNNRTVILSFGRT